MLLVSPNRQRRERFQAVLREIAPETEIDIASGAFQALKHAKERAHGAAVVLIDEPDEIALVIRLRKAHHDLPIIMITLDGNPEVLTLGGQMGADRVLRKRSDLRRNAEGLLRVLGETRQMIRTRRSAILRTRELVRDIRALTRAQRELIANMLGVAAACERGEFQMLVVEDRDADYLLLVRALRKSGLPPCCRRAVTSEEALQYLRGHGNYRDRSAFPMPSLVLSDLHLPGMSGLELLRKLREDEGFQELGFILHTSSERPEDAAEAARLGASFYVVKSSKSELVTEILGSVFARFIQERMHLAP
jgi:CheY-like chemotaxis protein